MNYLDQIKLSDIQLLIQDLKLLNKGYKFRLIIDAADVVDYAFPLGKNFDKTPTMDDIGDTIIAYEYIFDKYKPIILDEYKFELDLLRIYVDYTLEDKIKKNKNLFDVSLTNNIINVNDIEKSYTFLLSVSLFSNSMIDIFDNIVKNKLQVEKFKDIEDSEIYDIFKDSKSNIKWSYDVINKWYFEKGHTFIRGKVRNLTRDMNVIERISYINEHSKSKKFLFFYFSKAKMVEVFLNRDDVKKNLPTIENKNFNFHRMPKHSYLLFLLKSSDDPLSDLEMLEIIYNNDKNLTLDKLFKENTENKLVQNLIQKNILLKDNLENESLKIIINNNDKYKSVIQDFIHLLKNNKLDELSYKVNEMYDKIISNKKRKKLFSEFSLNVLFLQNISTIINTLLNKSYDIKVQKGIDKINGTFHHYPILLFLNNAVSYNYFYDIINYVIKPKNIRNNKKFIEYLNTLVDENLYINNLIKAFIVFLLVENNDNIIPILKLLEEEYFALIVVDNKNKTIDEFLYLLSWYYRRVKKYDIAEKYASEGKNRNNKDPRFHHAMALINYNKIVNKNYPHFLNNIDFPYIKELIVSDVDLAIELYNNIVNNNPNHKLKYYISGNIVSLYNLKLYVISIYYLNLFKENNFNLENYDIEYLRNCLDNIKKIIKEMGVSNNKLYGEIAHTESVFEIVEAMYYKYNNNNNKWEKKIRVSQQAIDEAIKNGEKNLELYRNTQEIINRIANQLQQSV